MTLHDWDEMPEETLNPLASRKVIHTERMTIAQLRLSKGAIVPDHSHENEQVTMLRQGRLRFVVSGEEKIVKGGECLQIPPNAPHSVEALEDSVAVDIFSPAREDWIRGDDAYLRR